MKIPQVLSVQQHKDTLSEANVPRSFNWWRQRLLSQRQVYIEVTRAVGWKTRFSSSRYENLQPLISPITWHSSAQHHQTSTLCIIHSLNKTEDSHCLFLETTDLWLPLSRQTLLLQRMRECFAFILTCSTRQKSWMQDLRMISLPGNIKSTTKDGRIQSVNPIWHPYDLP